MKLKNQQDKSKYIIREFNKLIKIQPVVLNKSQSKYKHWEMISYDTLGVKSDLIRIYEDYKSKTNFAISYINDTVKISREKTLNPTYEITSEFYKSEEREHKDLFIGTKSEFHEMLKDLLKILRDDYNSRNFEFVVKYFQSIN